MATDPVRVGDADRAGGPADPSRDASRPAGAHPSRVAVPWDKLIDAAKCAMFLAFTVFAMTAGWSGMALFGAIMSLLVLM